MAGRDLFAPQGRDLFANEPPDYTKAFAVDPEETGTLADTALGVAKGAIADVGAGGLQLLGEAGQALGIDGAEEFTQNIESKREEFVDGIDARTSDSPIASTVGRVAGSVAPMLAVPGGVQGSLAKRVATGAAAGSATAGAQYVEEGATRTKNTAVGALAGGGAPVVINGGKALASDLVKRFFRGGEKGRQHIAGAVEDFSEAGATPSLGQATDGFLQKGAETISNKLPGGNPIQAAAINTATKTQARLQQIADDITPVTGSEEAGRVIQKGIVGEGGFVDRFQVKSGELWGKVDELIGQDRAVGIQNTTEALDDLVQGGTFGNILDSSQVVKLKEAVEEAGGAVDYKTLKTIRSVIGQKISSNDLISDMPRAQLKKIYGALSQDIKVAAAETGDDAIKAYNRANNYSRSGHKRLDDFVERVAKKTDLDQLYRAVTKGGDGSATINAFKRSLTDNEWEAVVGNVVRRMGKATNSAQDDLGEAFSMSTFLTDWNKLGPAKNALFAGTPKLNAYRKNLDTIAKMASSVRDSSQALANPSGTATQGANMLAAGGTGMSVLLGEPATASLIAMGVISNNAAGRLMTNDRFIKWLATSTRIKQTGMPAHIGKLVAIAKNQQDAEDLAEFSGALNAEK